MPIQFTREMRSERTILAPDIFPTHLKLVREIFELHGYRLTILHDEGKHVLDAALKVLHNDICYPAICTIGQQLYALTSGEYDPDKVALIHFQTGGGCRASNYVMLLKKALQDLGLDDRVPVISLNFLGMDKNPGFSISLSMIAEAFRSFVYGDMLMLLRNQTLPYEEEPGAANALCDRWIHDLREQFRHHRGLTLAGMEKNLCRIAADFHALPQDRSRKKTKVGIVGEIYVKYSPFGNNGLEDTLHGLGCETMVPGALGFFQYCLENTRTDRIYYGGSPVKPAVSHAALQVTERWERSIEKALAPYPEFIAPMPFPRFKTLAERVIDPGVKMGEGWLLAGETAALIEKGYQNIVCAQPFGCLPNHIAGKGTVRRLRELYPRANIFPVDYDAGASRVNQENRIRLMLAIAGENEQNEDHRA